MTNTILFSNNAIPDTTHNVEAIVTDKIVTEYIIFSNVKLDKVHVLLNVSVLIVIMGYLYYERY